ncbi:four-carbon acid sugar kinase family protein [Shinella zoogloeoides]|uniref:Four-carbon acid sugar kinase family protein n=1 Tax=Shinella zoogloeoides TaxID=352475 RepID=A0A6N8TCY1_SHIZO|nr:four-carbon acid sugar kinase family protein [Shinella zoogloeoides]MXO01127.1 four-carbon acid sugar kinase family protein [Shinella zoogloeoides]UEX84337.1 four-carbon acid sugar kinase family protein [Shinella zoogloeoides]
MTRPLIGYYGDDFTGSTDVMEALASNGVATVLFLKVPEAALLSRFAGARAFGLAGTSRSETPDWMDVHLRAAFAWLKTLDAELTHYKVCSTFDSAPHVGSIGRAIEIGRAVFGNAPVPLVVGAPQIRRYTAFGDLFAAYQGRNYRIDRHPVMARHPVTPMDEANLLLHLARQTALSSALVDNVAVLGEPQVPAADIVLVDVLDAATQAAAGALLWNGMRAASRFVCGSSGVEYALIPTWRREGLIGEKPVFANAGPVERIAVVSGSVSPTTERQIRHALANGFAGVTLDPVALSGEDGASAIAHAVEAGLRALEGGRSVVLYTALGPAADRGGELDSSTGARHRLGRALGRIQSQLVARAGLSRVVVAGGDTSSHALGEMGIAALTLKMPLPQTPGSPLCIAHGGPADGLQIALKGGQVGGDDYFSMIRAGA